MDRVKPVSSTSVYVAPIAAALKNIQFWLTREESSSLIIAASTVRELKQQDLPAHVQIKANKRRGKRVTSRKRHYHESHTIMAYWPEDALLEGALFTLACVVRGEADFRIADYVLRCRTGDIVLFPPGAMDDPANPQNMANRVFGFANIVSRKVAKELPDLKLGLYAYSAHTQAPTKVEKLEPNIIVALANINSWCDQTKKMFDPQSPQNVAFVKLVTDWQRVATHKLWMREYSAYGWLGVYPMQHMLQDHVQSYEKLGFEAFIWPSEANWGSQMLLIYFKSQLQRDPHLDLAKELDLFYSNYYGPAASSMKAYYERWMHIFDESHIAAGVQGGISSGGRGMHILCSPALMKELGGYLDQAGALVKGQSLYEKRLEGVNAGYQLCQYVSKMLSLKMELGETKTNPRTSTTFLQTPKAEEEWEAMLEWLKTANNDQQNFEVQLRDNQPYATALLYMKRDVLENGKYSLFDEPALLKAQGFGKALN